jgi:hypothetical protein
MSARLQLFPAFPIGTQVKLTKYPIFRLCLDNWWSYWKGNCNRPFFSKLLLNLLLQLVFAIAMAVSIGYLSSLFTILFFAFIIHLAGGSTYKNYFTYNVTLFPKKRWYFWWLDWRRCLCACLFTNLSNCVHTTGYAHGQRSVGVPYVMQPRQMRETFKPVLPRGMYSMLFLL